MKQFDIRMGPEIAPAQSERPVKFWNMANLNDEEGEITLYGDVMSEKPRNWWTGEEIDGLYITPEGFMEDLATIRDKARINVKLNSGGGDLYTGIAIHNALKALPGQVKVTVEGIAASAASVIMCAGDTVSVFPGSLVMIHGVSTWSWDWMNIQDMKRLMESMDASERAVAEIYKAKTGIGTDTLRSMMEKETWMTGREAVEKGFADELNEDGDDPEIGMSADKKILIVNGICHNIEGMRNIPGTIPVFKGAKPAARLGANKRPASRVAEQKGGKKKMTMEELREQEPDLVAQIEQAARNAALEERTQETQNAVSAERRRLEEIDAIAASVPDREMVHDAKYGEHACTAQELSFRVLQQTAAAGQKFLADYAADGAASGAGQVGAAPNSGAPVSKEEEDMADITAVMNAYNNTEKGGAKA